MLQASSLLCVDQHGKVHTHSQLDAPNMMTFEEEFDDKSESDESINPTDNIEDDTIIPLFPNLEGILFWTSGISL